MKDKEDVTFFELLDVLNSRIKLYKTIGIVATLFMVVGFILFIEQCWAYIVGILIGCIDMYFVSSMVNTLNLRDLAEDIENDRIKKEVDKNE